MDLPPDVGIGHVLDLKNQLGEHFPNMEDIAYSRISGAREKWNAPLQEVIMPIRRPAEAGLVPVNLTPREKVPILNAVQRQSRVQRQTVTDPEGRAYPTNPQLDPLTTRQHDETREQYVQRLQASIADLEKRQGEHDIKRNVMNELDDIHPDDTDALMEWRDNSPTLQGINKDWRKVIDDDGKNGPYQVHAFRGGAHEPPPGLGKFYSNDPFHAAAYDLTDAPMIDKVRDLKGTTLETKKPLVIEHPDEAFSDPSINMNHVMDKLQLDAAGKQTYRDLVKENSMPKIEQFIAKQARALGHDSVLRHSPDDDFMEIMDLNN
jgi:hypothetical protein